MQDLLAAKFIFTLASSSDNQPIMKMFLFAQHVSTSNNSIGTADTSTLILTNLDIMTNYINRYQHLINF